MKRFRPFESSQFGVHHWRYFTAFGSAAFAASLMLTHAPSATAQAAYGSYVGAGPAFSVTEDEITDEDADVAGVLAVRYKFLEAPVSIRTQLFYGNGTAIVPTVSYDIPLNYRMDAYVGVGAAVPLSDRMTPVGDKTSFAIQPGIDYALPNSSFVVFGNSVIAIDAYEKGGNTAVSFQGGLGLRF